MAPIQSKIYRHNGYDRRVRDVGDVAGVLARPTIGGLCGTDWIGLCASLEVVARQWSWVGPFSCTVTGGSDEIKICFLLEFLVELLASGFRQFYEMVVGLYFFLVPPPNSAFFLVDMPSGSYVSHGGMGPSYSWFSNVFNS